MTATPCCRPPWGKYLWVAVFASLVWLVLGTGLGLVIDRTPIRWYVYDPSYRYLGEDYLDSGAVYDTWTGFPR